jgi:lycopene elongase/hydratase (dihydrobisanhydrobacterioruberin-forming)
VNLPLSLRKVWKLSRPRFWMYVFGPFIVGLVAGAPSPNHILQPLNVAWALYFLFPANILVYGVNDIFDYETDKDNPKKSGYEDLVTPAERAALWKIIALTNIPFLILLTFVSTQSALCLLGFWFFSLFYSVPPIRAKARPILDSVFNVLYIFPGAMAYFLAGGENFSVAYFVAAWLWAMAMHAYSAVPDISADKDANVPTVATLLGFYGTILFCTFLYAASTMIAFRGIGRVAALLGIVYIALMFFSIRSGDENKVRRIYKVFPYVNTLCGFVLFWTIAIARFFPKLL